MLKRLFDLLVCIAASPVLIPAFGIIALLIKVDSRGAVFYLGIRTGRFGRPFKIFKFRTMILDAEQLGGGTTALNDPRVTRVGRVLRKYKLDELPQIFNVIKGDMSLVGPRPELPEYTRKYQGEEKIILTVRPGITDYCSVAYSSLDEHVGEVEADAVFEERILPEKNRLRIRYVREQSFKTDLIIITKTFRVILLKLMGKSAG
jgi:lipopolysaccharide/colanic/teichoic acid biosynthesis glycosyltransferase